MKKRQIWMTPEQVDLAIECLMFARTQINEGIALSDAHKMAGRFTYRRICELIDLIRGTPEVSAITLAKKA